MRPHKIAPASMATLEQDILSMQEAAHQRSGRSYEAFVCAFSAAVNTRFDHEPLELRETALQFARVRGYKSAYEIEVMLEELAALDNEMDEGLSPSMH